MIFKLRKENGNEKTIFMRENENVNFAILDIIVTCAILHQKCHWYNSPF